MPIEIDLIIDISNRLYNLLKTETIKMNERLDSTIVEFKEVVEDLSFKLEDVINTMKDGKG